MNKINPRVAFYTLGCKVNQNETESMAALFNNKGYDIVEFDEKADIYILNTCTVTHLADRKSRQLIRRCTKNNPDSLVVVAGCYAQVSPEEIESIPGVNLILGTSGKNRIVEMVEGLRKEKKQPINEVEVINKNSCFEEIGTEKIIDRARAYLKVQDGCEQFCTYCIIPYARGPIRSRTIESAVRESDKLIEAGFKEIILTGIHLGLYGRDIGNGTTLATLLSNLILKDKEVRWRLSSLEPIELSDEILDQMRSNSNFCPHLHLPLQAAHNDILKAMNRPYTTEEYRRIIENARKAIPDIAITTDLMVGFPGETESHFQAYLEFIEEMAFSGMHIFKYSPRRGTPAAAYSDQIAADIKEKRSRKMRLLADGLEKAYAKRFIGCLLNVLVEKEVKEGIWEGHSENYLQIYFASNTARRGEVLPVQLQEIRNGLFWGASYQAVSE